MSMFPRAMARIQPIDPIQQATGSTRISGVRSSKDGAAGSVPGLTGEDERLAGRVSEELAGFRVMEV